MNNSASIVAVVLVSVASLVVGAFGLRLSRTMSDFYVASRGVSPVLNASAISGEYLSAASFLGVAGLILARGVDMLWLPIGWTAGYLLLLVFVAAPLRRSGAYTLPDFARLRLESVVARRASSLLVVAIGLLYLIPQFQGAGLTLRTLTGAPSWVGQARRRPRRLPQRPPRWHAERHARAGLPLLACLLALLTPLFLLLGAVGERRDDPDVGAVFVSDWVEPLQGDHALYLTYSLVLATFFGTMGLPHVVVRFYTNPDGRAARRTTLAVLVLLSGFYLLPVVYGVIGRYVASDLVAAGRADSVVLEPAEPALRRPRRGGADRRSRRRRLRGVPVDIDRSRRVGRRRRQPGPRALGRGAPPGHPHLPSDDGRRRGGCPPSHRRLGRGPGRPRGRA